MPRHHAGDRRVKGNYDSHAACNYSDSINYKVGTVSSCSSLNFLFFHRLTIHLRFVVDSVNLLLQPNLVCRLHCAAGVNFSGYKNSVRILFFWGWDFREPLCVRRMTKQVG